MATVSVIIPTRNRRRLLRECIESVQAQSFTDWEAIVCDDGSTDGTAEFVRDVALRDPRVRYVPTDGRRRGAPSRRNDGMRVSEGEFVLFLDDDDLLFENCLERRVAELRHRPDVDFVLGNSVAFTESLADSTRSFRYLETIDPAVRFLCDEWVWQTSGPLFRLRALESVGLWNERLDVGQDVEYMCRCLFAGLRFHAIDQDDYGVRGGGTDHVGRRHGDPLFQYSHLVHVRGLVSAHPDRCRERPVARSLMLKLAAAVVRAPPCDRRSFAIEASRTVARSGCFSRSDALWFCTVVRVFRALGLSVANAMIERMKPTTRADRVTAIERLMWQSWNLRDRRSALACLAIWASVQPARLAHLKTLLVLVLRSPRRG